MKKKTPSSVIKPQSTARHNNRPGEKTTLEVGEQKELQAENYLTMRGLIPVARNYRCKLGEIDLIMADGEYLVFVEVRFRRSAAFGYASETINYRKQTKLLRTAQRYLQQHNITDNQPCRFDTLCIQGLGSQQAFDWVKNAFA
jgi:putative endonuclease